jgi:hypothetical protein
MLVPDVVRKSVIFLGKKHPKDEEIRVGGTAFVVAIPRFPLERAFVYLVTAKHCIDDIKRLSAEGLADGKVYLRINSKTAALPPVETDPDEWFFHPTEPEKVDVAVYPILSGYDGWDVQNFVLKPDDSYVTSKIIEDEKIGPGDEVFIAGLFTKHSGKTKNIPIIRIGNIAAMAEEPVYPRWCPGHPMEAYLIEARSIGGLSGSPVFVNVGTRAGIAYDGAIPHRGSNAFYLLNHRARFSCNDETLVF